MNESKTYELSVSEQKEWAVIEKVLTTGDLAPLNAQQRVMLYNKTCQSVNLNPLTRPFDFLEMKAEGGKKKIIMYATKNCTDQLRRVHKITIEKVETNVENGCIVCTVSARNSYGESDVDCGVVSCTYGAMHKVWGDSEGRYVSRPNPMAHKVFVGDDYANARMKALTKAKRRVTLSICGLGMLDESEIETIKGARVVNFDDAKNVKALSNIESNEIEASAMEEQGCNLSASMVREDNVEQVPVAKEEDSGEVASPEMILKLEELFVRCNIKEDIIAQELKKCGAEDLYGVSKDKVDKWIIHLETKYRMQHAEDLKRMRRDIEIESTKELREALEEELNKFDPDEDVKQ